MRKSILMSIMLISVLLAVPALAAPSLGTWNIGDPGTTHEYWNFAPASQNPGDPTQFYPTDEFNPNDGGKQVFAQVGLGSYIQSGNGSTATGAIVGKEILVDLRIMDYLNNNAYKTVWVDLGLTNGSVASATLTAAGNNTIYTVTPLLGPGPGTGADFGFLVQPNPYYEDILIDITGLNGGSATLKYVDVDTICVPVPGAILLGSIGVGLVGWLRRKRTL